MNDRIDRLARAFADAAHELAEALLPQLEASPEIAAQINHAVQHGARPLLGLQIHPFEPCIRMLLIDDYGATTGVLTIPGRQPVRQ